MIRGGAQYACSHWAARRPATGGPRKAPCARLSRGRATAAQTPTAGGDSGVDDRDAGAHLLLLLAAARRANVAVVLVEPQICENIGAAARAMRNFGIAPPNAAAEGDRSGGGGGTLRLVRPRDGFPPPPLAFDVACGGADLLASATCHDTLEEALADRHVVYAATARARRQALQVVSSRELAADFARRCAAVERSNGGAGAGAGAGDLGGNNTITADDDNAADENNGAARVALVFGRESSGLTNAEVGLAHAVVEVDACSGYPVLNLGQAVLAVLYELWGVRQGGGQRQQEGKGDGAGGGGRSCGGSGGDATTKSDKNNNNGNPAASSGQVDALLARLYASLEAGGFFTEREKRPSVERSLSALLRRVDGLGARDLALLHGALTAIGGREQLNKGR